MYDNQSSNDCNANANVSYEALCFGFAEQRCHPHRRLICSLYRLIGGYPATQREYLL